MTVKELLAKTDELGRAWFRYLYSSNIGYYDFDEERTLAGVMQQFQDHFAEVNGKWKVRPGHSYDMMNMSWDVQAPPKTIIPLALSEPTMYFNDVEIYGHSPLLLGAETDSVWHPLVMQGVWHHPTYGQVNITADDIAACAQNFKNQIIGGPIPVDELEGHAKSTEGAYGWVTDVQVGTDALYGKIEWTDLGQKAVVEEKRYKYVSPRLFNKARPYVSTVNGQSVPNVITAVALTNHPTFVGQPDVSIPLSEYVNDETIELEEPIIDEVTPMPEPTVTENVPATPPVPAVDPAPVVEPPVVPEPVTLSAEVPDAIASRVAALEAELVSLRQQNALELCNAQFNGMTFSIPAVVADEAGVQSVQTLTARMAPADQQVIVNAVVALNSVAPEAALALSQMYANGGPQFITMGEQGLGLSNETPADDETWLKGLNYAPDTLAAIRAHAESNKVSLREAHAAVFQSRVTR